MLEDDKHRYEYAIAPWIAQGEELNRRKSVTEWKTEATKLSHETVEWLVMGLPANECLVFMALACYSTA
jgi:hypothetical protein